MNDQFEIQFEAPLKAPFTGNLFLHSCPWRPLWIWSAVLQPSSFRSASVSWRTICKLGQKFFIFYLAGFKGKSLWSHKYTLREGGFVAGMWDMGIRVYLCLRTYLSHILYIPLLFDTVHAESYDVVSQKPPSQWGTFHITWSLSRIWTPDHEQLSNNSTLSQKSILICRG